MGLKGYRLWGMGQLDSTCRSPPRRATACVAVPSNSSAMPAPEVSGVGVAPAAAASVTGASL
jgi:hypothetical protein